MAIDALVCNKPNCTLAETGTCILQYNPKECPDRLKSLISSDSENNIQLTTEPVLKAPVELKQLSGSNTLNLQQVKGLMENRYCKIIGILGAPNAGKTACLVSLYLLLAHDKLNAFKFRDSKSLRAFEEISKGARWSLANPNEELTTHTKIEDERTPGFLHLRLLSVRRQKCFDLLLPDLPGEWSTTLINENRIERLGFLKAADSIWLMANGEEITSTTTHKSTVHRLNLLIDRITNLYQGIKPPITLVVSRKDQTVITDKHVEKILKNAERNGFQFSTISIASFSENDSITPGDGIASLIEMTINQQVSTFDSSFWPVTPGVNNSPRHMLRYRK